MEISARPARSGRTGAPPLKIAESRPPRPTRPPRWMEETQILKWMSQPSTTFKTIAHGVHVDAAHEHVIEAEGDGGEGARRLAVAQLEIAGGRRWSWDVIEGSSRSQGRAWRGWRRSNTSAWARSHTGRPTPPSPSARADRVGGQKLRPRTQAASRGRPGEILAGLGVALR